MKYLKVYEQFSKEEPIRIDRFLWEIGLPHQRVESTVQWWSENRDHIKIYYFPFNTEKPISGVYLGSNEIAVNQKVGGPAWFRLFLALHESRHCDQHREGRLEAGYFDTVVAGDREEFLRNYRLLEMDANDFAIGSMRALGFEEEMRAEERRLRGNEGVGLTIWSMMQSDIRELKATNFIDLLKKQVFGTGSAHP